MAAGSPAPPQGNPQNPGSSLSSIFNFLKQFAGGGGAAAQAAGTPGGAPGANQTPQPQPVQNPSLMPGQPNGVLQQLGNAILQHVHGFKGMDNQDPTYLKGKVDEYMKNLESQKKAAQHLKKAVPTPRGAPQSQVDVSQPFHDLFHSVMSGLQS
jgi:hypothetical protein